MNLISKILIYIKKIAHWSWHWIDLILKLAWRFIVPIALIGLLIVPIALTYFPASKKPEPIIVKAAEVGDITKKITVQGTTEYAYSYDLPVYNDATLTEVLVKAGDKVTAGQVLAKLDFVTENKIRATSVENQIRGYQQEISNNNQSLVDAQNVAGANNNQMKISRSNRALELNELNHKRTNKIKELNEKKTQYQKEKDDFDRRINELENIKDANEAIKQYQKEIDSLKVQLAQFDYSNANAQLQSQQTSAASGFITAQTNLNSAQNNKNNSCSAPIVSQANCDTTTAQLIIAQGEFNTANTTNNNINNQINNNNNNGNVNKNYLNNQINDLQNKINQLSGTNIVNQNITTSIAITDQAKSSRLQTIIAELRQDSGTRKANIKQIDDTINDTITPINEQIQAKEKVINELDASNYLSQQTMAQTASGIQQRNNTAINSLNNSNLTLNDTIEDIQKQEQNKTITAKKSGIVGKVFTEQGLVAKSRENQFTVVSDKYRLKFTVSADSRSQLKNGLKVIADKYPKLENIVITEANFVPDVAPASAVSTSANVNYTIYAQLPESKEYNYTQGETINVDVIISEVKNVLYIPSTSVDKDYVYVGEDPTFPDSKKRSNSVSNSSNITVDPATLPTFKSAKKVKIKTGLDDNKNIQILDGLKAGEWVFTIYPRTEKDRGAIKAPEENTVDPIIEVNDGTSGIPDPE